MGKYTQGGTHQSAFREAIVKTVRELIKILTHRYSKIYHISHQYKGNEPVFESQTKTKLGSTDMGGDLPTVRTYINDFIGTKLELSS